MTMHTIKFMRYLLETLGLIGLLALSPALAAALLVGDTFTEQITDNVAAGDPIPIVRLFFSGEGVPTAVEKVTETRDSYHLDIYYFYIPPTQRTLVAEYELSGDLVGTTSLAASNYLFDWSARQGISVNPFNMESNRYYRLTFTSNAPSRVSGRRTDYFYFALQHGDAPLPVANQAPSIELLPAPGADMAFQASISADRGFSIFVEDADGYADLDLDSFSVKVAGVDKTAHFRALAGALGEDRLSMGITEKNMVFFFRPHPALFTSAHNLFNLQWNGDWPVQIGICDKSGACAERAYQIYLGAFLRFSDAKDLRCTDPGQHIAESLLIGSYTMANIGFDAPLSFVYLGLQSATSQQLWTYYLSQLGIGILSDNLYPLLPALPMPAGIHFPGGPISFGLSALINSPGDDWYSLPLASGAYKLIATVHDTESGTMPLFSQELQVCRP
jgi:hypothetical protein